MILSVEDVTLTAGARTLCRDLNFGLEPGETLVLLGPNGSGKSTLLRAIVALQPVERGRILLNGEPLPLIKPTQRARHMAYMAQEEYPHFPFTVWESVMLGATAPSGFRSPTASDRNRVGDLLDRMGLAPLAHKPLGEISGGERQRARLARTLAQETGLLVLDEPAASLDVAHSTRLPEWLNFEDRAVVISIHDLNLGSLFSARALLICPDGEAIIMPMPELLRSPQLDRAFGTSFQRVESPQGLVLRAIPPQPR